MRNFSVIILIVSIISSVIYSQPFWQQTNGPVGGNSYQVTKAPNGDLYAAAGLNGLYKSTNSGNSWSRLLLDEIALDFNQAYYVYASANGNIYAGGGGMLYGGGSQVPNQGIFRSTDNGNTWQKVLNSGRNRIVGFTESSNGNLYAARFCYESTGEFGGVYKSTDNGSTWAYTQLSNPFDQGVTGIAADNSGNVYACEREGTFFRFWKSSNSGASWTSTQAIQLNQVIVKKSNGFVFIRKNSGVFLSVNQGSTFNNVSSGFFPGCDKIWIDDAEAIYAAASNQLYRSTDNGTTWVNLSFTFPPGFNDMLPLSGNTFYACANNNFMYRTTNFGANWLKLETGVVNSNVISLAVTNTGILYGVKDTTGLYSSTDNGTSWQLLSTPTLALSFVSVDSASNVFIASGSSLYRSTNNGSNWQPSGSGLPASNIKFLKVGHDRNLYLCTNDTLSGIFKSTNNGSSWFSIGLPYNLNNNILAANSLGHVYAVQNYINLYRTTNGGANWSLVSNNHVMTHLSINHINGELYATNGGGFSKSTNNGSNWINIINGLNNLSYTGVFVAPNGILYGIGYNGGANNSSGSNFYTSTNNGNLWTSIQSGWDARNTFTRAAVVGANGYFYTSTFRFWIENEGNLGVWRSVTSSNTFTLSGTVRYQDNNQIVTSGHVKAVKYLNGQMLTLDSAGIQPNGAYTLTKVPQDSVDVMAFQDDEDNLNFVPTYYQSTISWQLSNTLYPTGSLNNINIGVYRINNTSSSSGNITGTVFGGSGDYYGIKDARIYAKLGGVYKAYSVSISNGTYNIDSLPNGSYELICDMIGYAGQTRNVTLNGGTLPDINFYLTDFLIPVQNISSEVPRGYALYQNYPNPFNPVTAIRFDIPKKVFVKLKIFDMLGREVAALSNQELDAGSYSVMWNASIFASGVYFYRLETDEWVETKKLVLIK